MKRDSQDLEIRACFDDKTIRVYQAYSKEIAGPTLQHGRFVAPFSFSRMTWIKPSFNWMMYRSGYGTKPRQECILGIDITRSGFAWALNHSVLSAFDPLVHESMSTWRQLLEENPVRIQWDPERDWKLNKLGALRTIQIGLSGEAVMRYVNEWVVRIEDVTPVAHILRDAASAGVAPAGRPDQDEAVYPIGQDILSRITPSTATRQQN